MGMTMTQKILAAHAGLPSVSAGQLIEADLDLVLGNDITSPVAIHEMDKMKVDGVFDKDKIALVLDHFVPNKDIKSAQHCKCVREFACRHDITNYFDVGEMGIEHALLPEKGLTVAGDVIIGADSLYNFDTWREPGRICQEAVLVVATRDHTPLKELDQQMKLLAQKYNGKFIRLDTMNIDVSSELLRSWHKSGQSLRYYVPQPVISYIEKNDIYKGNDSDGKI